MKTPLLLFTSLLLLRGGLFSAPITGQITHAVTTLPLDGATITLDQEPADGTPEATAHGDWFGYYSLPDVADGIWRLTAKRRGFEEAQRTLTIAGGARVENVPLQPLTDGPYVDLYVTVLDATANTALGAVPLVINRYDTEADPTPEVITSLPTDNNGRVLHFGLKAGWYEFQLNSGAGRRGGYETYPKSGGFTSRTHINRPHQLTLHLKHVPQTVKLAVTGCNPNTEADGPMLRTSVELTAVSALDHTVQLTPPRWMETDDTGSVQFADLAPLHWRVIARRDGYDPTEIFLVPAGADERLPGAQLGPSHPVPMTIHNTALQLELTSIYPHDDYYDGIEVTLEGIEETNTQGIRRSLDSGTPDGHRLFEKLVPGFYIAHVNDTFEPDDPDTTPSPHFRADFLVEAVDGATTIAELPLEVTPALVRVRLHTAETLGNIQSGGRDDLVLRLPVYQPRQVATLQCGLDTQIQSQPTDLNGEAVFEVYPGLYGFGVPELTDFYGAHVVVRQTGDADGRRQGWPTLSGMPGYEPRDGDDGEPLVINSAGDYQIDLFANKKRANFFLRVLTASNNPTGEVVQGIAQPPVCAPFQEILAEPAEFTLTNTATNAVTNYSVVQRDGPLVEMPDLTPGTYRLAGTHPRYTITIEPAAIGTPDTFTIPPWPDFPGSDLKWAPPPFSLYNHVTFYHAWPTGGLASAVYKTTSPVTLRHYTWDESADPPEYRHDWTNTDPVFDYIRPVYAGGALFCAARRPLGNFTLWLREGSQWFTQTVSSNGAVTIDIRSGGPQNNLGASGPTAVGQITLRAVSRVAPDEEIPGIQFRLSGSAALFNAGTITVPSQYNGPISLASTIDPTGRFLLKSSRTVTSGAYNNNVLIVAEMGRALNISGTVQINNATNARIPRAKVQFFDRFGDARFPSKVADANGAFSLPSTLETPAFFVEVKALGYKPWRKRFSSNDPAIGGTGTNGSLSLDIRLDPLPLPVPDPPSIDRYGLYMPYISLASNGLGNLGEATQQLTATWQGSATAPPPTTVTLPKFDLADGTPGGTSDVTIEDPVVLLALVDPRLLPRDVSRASGNGASGAPQEGDFDYPPPGVLTDVPARRRWWDSITSQTFTGPGGEALAGHRVRWLHPEESLYTPNGNASASGKVKLWEIHPGKFKPVLVAETKHGAIGVLSLEPQTPRHQLRGLRPPRWLANLAQLTAISGRSSGSPELRDRILDTVDKGRFEMLPIIKGDVEAIGGFLIYTYDFSLNWLEGTNMPGDGFAGNLPGFAGLATEAAAGVKLDGTQEKLSFEIRGEASTRTTRKDAWIPGVIPGPSRTNWTDRTLRKWRAGGGGSVSISSIYDEDADPLNLVMSLNFTGGASAEMRYDLRPWLATLQPVGPLVAGASRSADVVLTGAIGLQSSTSWTTHYPRPVNVGASGVAAQPEQGHFLGGRATPDTPAGGLSQKFGLCFNASLGLDIQSRAGIAGASAAFHLRGNDCVIPIAGSDNLPSMRAVPNFNGSFPWLKEISGRLDIETKAYLDVFITRLERKWRWTLWEFKQQLGTESVFELVPLDITVTKTGPDTFTPVEWRGTSPQLVQKWLPIGRMGAVSGTPGLLLFTDVDAATGRMQLKSARRSTETTWAAPVTVREAPGIIAAKITRLSAGTLLAVWSELAENDLSAPSPPSALHYATSADDGVTWSSSQIAASLTHTAAELFLGTSGTTTALVWLAPSGSPEAPQKSAHAMRFVPATGWTAPAQLFAAQELSSFDAAVYGGAVPVTAAWTTSAGALRGLGWNGTTPNPAQTAIATGVKPGVALLSGNAGSGLLASLPNSGGFQFHIAAGTTFITFAAPVWTSARPSQLKGALISGSPARYALAWTEESDGALAFGFTDTLGTPSGTPTALTPATPLRYGLGEVIPGPAGHATILATTAAAPAELRQFVVSPAGGLVFADRDGDSLNDRDELRLVDAVLNDALTLIDHVLPGGDFDNDGATNAAEFASGTDATDATSRPVPDGVTVTASQPDAQEFGLLGAQFTLTRSDATTAADVAVAFSGSAGPSDYSPVTSPLHFDAGVDTLVVSILPVNDSLPEGAESLTITLQPGAGYSLGTPAFATITIHDRPSDDWRFVQFPANPAGTPFLGDSDGDGINELMEFGLALDPLQPSSTGLPVLGVTSNGLYPTLTYTRPETSDLTYTVQVTPGAGPWTSGFPYTQEISRISNPNNTQTVTVQSLTPFSAANIQLLRLEVRR